MHSLPVFLRLTGQPVLLIGSGDAAEAKRRLIERAGAHVVAQDDSAAAARIAFVVPDADGDPDVLAAHVARLRARGLLVNVADWPALCDFTLPAIVDRDPVIIAIGTGGASAGLAKEVRQRLERWLPPSLGSLANALGAARQRLRARFPDTAERRRAIDAALAPGGALDPLDPGAPDVLDRWLDDAAPAPPGQVVRLSLTSDDPDDLTLRQARWLGRADALWHRGDVPDTILSRARADAARIIADTPPPAPASGLIAWVEML